MLNNPNFLDYLSRDLLVIAANNDYDFVFIDNQLKKGTWKTMPNGVHVFLVDGTIQAGPYDTIGHKPEDLHWDKMDRKLESPLPEGHKNREEVTQKYMPEMMEAKQIKDKSRRNAAVEKIWNKMVVEDEYYCIFLGKNPEHKEFLNQLAKDFSSYGNFPLKGSFEEQVIWYRDKVALLHDLKKFVPQQSIKDVENEIDVATEAVNELIKKGPTSSSEHTFTKTPLTEQDTQPIPQQQNPSSQSNSQNNSQNAKTQPIPQVKHPKQNINNPSPAPRPSNNNRPQPKPQNSNRIPVRSPKKQPVAKTPLMLRVEHLLASAFKFTIAVVSQWLAKSAKSSNAYENKMLYKVTKNILSRINVNERDKIFDVFLKTFSTK